jgi:Right handed beta helix region
MRRLVFIATVAAVLTIGAGPGAATAPATLVVDRDGVECANAEFSSIQPAVDAAQPGDLIRVCPDLYSETVVVDKPLTLKADPDAVAAIDCFQPTLGELPVDQQAIVDPSGEGFSIAFKLQADDVVLEGFVIQGATVGIDASDRFSGYRIHHNLVRLNTLFAIDFGSEGTRKSRVDHNCIRDALPLASGLPSWGLVSELDDDSLWPDLANRGLENARDLRNATIEHNSTFRNQAGLEAAGPGVRRDVTFAHNVSRKDLIGIALQNSTDSAILDNEITASGPGGSGIIIGGGNDRLLIAANRVDGARGIGVLFVETFIDRFPIPSRNVVVARNELTRNQVGIRSNPNNLTQSSLLENTTSENRINGIVLFNGNTDSVIRGNHADNNGANGIFAMLGATGNHFDQNSMHGNGSVDARDANPLLNGMLQNDWTGNDCNTDFPAGLICGVG